MPYFFCFKFIPIIEPDKEAINKIKIKYKNETVRFFAKIVIIKAIKIPKKAPIKPLKYPLLKLLLPM